MPIWPSLRLEIDEVKKQHLYRFLEEVSSERGARIRVGQKNLLNFSSNNYLGLASCPRVVRAAAGALKKWGTGSGASRLLSGNLKVHEDLEKEIARLKKEESALIFSSGYLANLGVVTALLNDKDLVLVDRLNHASLVDAAKLSRAKLWVYPNRDVTELDRLLSRARNHRRKLVMTDSYFSMDGTVAPLDALLTVCEKHEALLMVDEAHSTGVFGGSGAGLSEHFGLQGKIPVVMGTLSKALGSAGGYIAGKKELRETLVNRSRMFIYTTGPTPAASAAALESIRAVREEPQRREKLWRNTRFLREGLLGVGYDLFDSLGPIIPVRIGDPSKAIRVRELLRREGIFAPAIRPPTVPRGTDRVRLSVTAAHSKSDLERTLRIFKKIRDRAL
ncbi:MAG TPA: 8-amino-7-oxononanoate synthase [Candidatus Omnitrophota bacterium]|nr:8-amino-7-oxononanoate synthase [Candidatus Omnitrophota bacterium]